jgi:hypothetical protein
MTVINIMFLDKQSTAHEDRQLVKGKRERKDVYCLSHILTHDRSRMYNGNDVTCNYSMLTLRIKSVEPIIHLLVKNEILLVSMRAVIPVTYMHQQSTMVLQQTGTL